MPAPHTFLAWMCLLVLGMQVSAARPVQAQGDAPRRAVSTERALVDSLVQPLTADVPWGAVVGIVDANGRRYMAYSGNTRDSSVVVDSTTIFEIGSITKTFTGLLLADLVARGAVALDTPVAALLPDSVQMPSFEGQLITLRHLVTHRSGLPRLPDNLLAAAKPLDPYAGYGAEELYSFLDGYTLSRAPGEAYAYSNLGTGLLGHALAVQADTSYAALIQQRIADPLGLTDTAIRLSTAQRRRFAQGYNGFQTSTPPWTFETIAGAGAVRSTARDQLRYLAAHMGLIQTPLDATLQRTRVPLAEARAADSVAYGWHIRPVDDPAGDATLVWHNGGTGGFASFAGYVPERNVGIVLLVNGRPADQQVTKTGFRLLTALAAVARPPAD